MKATLGNLRASRFPAVIGVCADDPTVAQVCNECQQRLIDAAGETGWANGWSRVAFTISRANPYITLPRQFVRAINLDVCSFPINLNNEFYEFLPGGVGLKGVNQRPDWCGNLEGFERGTSPVMVDLTPTNQRLRVYLTDTRDAGRRVLIQGALDQNGVYIYSQDGLNTVDGFYLTLGSPFTDSGFICTGFNAIQKDQTYGDVVLKQVDDTTGVEVTLARYAPDEVNPAYRRYYISHVPTNCPCPTGTATVTVTAMAKLAFIPVARDTDQLIIGNIPALIEEAQAIRYSEMDVPNAAAMEARHHAKAIRLLQNELRSQMGEQRIAVVVDRWGNQPLCAQSIGNLI